MKSCLKIGWFLKISRMKKPRRTKVNPAVLPLNLLKTSALSLLNLQCVKSVHIWSFSGPFSVWIRENAYRKKSEYGQFTQSLLSMLQKLITFSIRYKLWFPMKKNFFLNLLLLLPFYRRNNKKLGLILSQYSSFYPLKMSENCKYGFLRFSGGRIL